MACSLVLWKKVLFGAPVAVRIACGSSENSYSNRTNLVWLKDFGYMGGSSASIPEGTSMIAPQLNTLRYFQYSDGAENCYNISVPIGRYLMRFFFTFGEVDNSNTEPQFDVSLEGTLTFPLQPGWSSYYDQAYPDALVYVDDGAATACFHSSGHGNPAVVSLEILQINELAYELGYPWTLYVILKTVKRVSCNALETGYGIDLDADPWGGDRFWGSDIDLNKGASTPLKTTAHITNCCGAPNFYPEVLYQSAATTGVGENLYYSFQVEPNQNYSIWLHFAEISPNITQKGQRIFQILVNDQPLFMGVDIVGYSGGPFTAIVLNKTIFVEGRTLTLTLKPVQGGILINGFEIYQLVPMEYTTVKSQVWALQALKDSLGVPSRLGWNGDPCVPQEHPWIGVDCGYDFTGNAWFLAGLSLSHQGLKGHIAEDISYLPSLQSINMSSNSLSGAIPSQLGNLSNLEILDISFNKLNGSIPGSLGNLTHLQELYLNGNQLKGEVPVALLSGPIHGASFNFSDNSGLCGIPGLSSCGILSSGSKVGLAVGTTLGALILVVCILAIRQRRYNIARAKRSHDAPFARSRLSSTPEVQLQKLAITDYIKSPHLEHTPQLLQ
ncbi:hypothetical protein O6H91_Y427000 [Diphasiastrum complanatum]|nr:hypothetical protein O6H91_Y427000 [Diphasiastrum complanatum]